MPGKKSLAPVSTARLISTHCLLFGRTVFPNRGLAVLGVAGLAAGFFFVFGFGSRSARRGDKPNANIKKPPSFRPVLCRNEACRRGR